MSRRTIKDMVKDYYADQSLPAERLARLKGLAGGGDPMSLADTERTGGSRRRRGVHLLMAAGIAVPAFVAGYFVSHLAGSAPPMTTRSASDSAAAADLSALPDLVAVNIRADWCRRSPEVAPIFTEFTDKYGNEPILFVTMDITDEQSRMQAHYLASSLSIDPVFDKPFESGMIKLVDRKRGAIVATLTGAEQIPGMEGLLAQALSVRSRED